VKGAFHDASQEPLDVEVDVVVIGSGAGGGAAARTLTDAGLSVLVLEEGPYIEAAMLGFKAFDSLNKMMRNGGHQAAIGKAAMPIIQACVVGGTTFVNSAIIWRLPEKVLAQWQKEHGLADGFRANELDDAYAQLERDMFVREVEAANVNGSDRKMALGAAAAGIEHRAIHRNERECKGSGRCLHGCHNNAKQSTAINYLRRAAELGAQVFSHARADVILRENGKAVGVRGTARGNGPRAGMSFTARARRAVIVAASVIQSPNLLRRNGIGRDNDALGNHFMAHPGTSLVGLYKDPVNTWTGAAQGYEAYGLRDTLGIKFESINVPPEVAASRLPGFGASYQKMLERMPHMAIWSAAIKADGVGSVRPSRLLGGDLIRYNMIEADFVRLRQGLKRLAEMHFLAGATEVLPGVHGLPDSIQADQLSVFDSAPLDGTGYGIIATHLFGTCRAGSDTQHSVVDGNLQVHHTPNLYVMDASVFPSNTGVNPQHSIMAIATMAARRLASA